MARIKFTPLSGDASLAELIQWLSAFTAELNYILNNLDEENHTAKYNERTGMNE